MRFASLILCFLFACVAGLPHLYLEARQNNVMALMKRGNAPTGGIAHEMRIRWSEDPEIWAIHNLRKPGWIKKICTSTDAYILHITDQTFIRLLKIPSYHVTAHIVVKEVRWQETDVKIEIDILGRVRHFVAHGYNRKAGKHYIVMRYLGIGVSDRHHPPDFPGDNWKEIAEAGKQKYEETFALIRDPDPLENYVLDQGTTSKKWSGHPAGSWRKAKEKIPYKPLKAPMEPRPHSYEEWE